MNSFSLSAGYEFLDYIDVQLFRMRQNVYHFKLYAARQIYRL
jgi:hypothetical protein